MNHEKNGGGYRELEKEIIEESINAFKARAAKADMAIDAVDEDPRVTATLRETARAGFSMTKGQYHDVSK